MKRSKSNPGLSAVLRRSCERVLFEQLEQRVCLSGLSLTQAGVDAGFTLSTFASNFPNINSTGPLGIAFPAGGKVLVSDAPGNVHVFPSHADGQNAATAPIAKNYGTYHALGMAQLGTTVYMTDV